MSNIIQGVKVDGTIYKYDYESLENLPDPELPSATASDEGKALVVNSTGNPAWKTPASGLPSYSPQDAGKVLVLGSSEPGGSGNEGPQWGSALPTGSSIGFALVIDSTGKPAWKDLKYPTCGPQDRGKALVVNTTGDPVWSTLSGALPTIGSHDEHKALVVNNFSNRAVWAELLPACDTPDSGKVLAVDSNRHYVLSEIGAVLDADPNGSDEGKVLVANSSGEAVWRDLLPTHDTSYEGSDAGKALIVATNGELKWDEAGGGGSLPLPDTSDASEGDVLIVGESGDSISWGSPFPDYDEYDDVGKVLMITQNSGMMWHESLPTYDTSTDVGKVLMITSNGPEWGTPSN